MTIAQGSRHELAYVTEVTPGTTPGTPTMKRLRNTGVQLDLGKNTFQSAEIRADRMLTSLRHTVRNAGGAIPFEMSFGSFDDILESALMGTWTTNVLKAGTTGKSFSMERRFTDVSQYLVYTECRVNTFKLTIPSDGGVTGEFGMVARNMTRSGTSLGTPTDVTTNDVMTADLGTISEGGSGIGYVTSLELELNNNLQSNYVVGSNFSREMTAGRSILTGTLEAFFESEVLLNKFLNETESSLSIVIQDSAANDYIISLPRIKYTGAPVPVEGEESIKVTLPFTALRDGTLGSQISITR